MNALELAEAARWPEPRDPKVVITDGPPPTVVCRSPEEAHACEALLALLRQGRTPLAFIYRQVGGGIEVHARGSEFPTARYAAEVMEQASVKLTSMILHRRVSP